MTDLPPPPPPRPEHLDVRRKGPIGWLNLGLLFDTGILAAISAAADARTTRREVLATLDPAPPDGKAFHDFSTEAGDGFWVDYIADLGEGFDATQSVAWLVGRDWLGIGPPGEAIPQPIPPDRRTECPAAAFPGDVLPAGRMLILGGDLVYPTPTLEEYQARTIGPYCAARPWQLDANGAPQGRALFAIPGNHDWYDGLGAFVQRFCQPGRWMGCWQVRQRRSYFAIRLPHGVWIWGLDLATSDNFDAPQLDYFKDRAADLAKGDSVILCVPTPGWVYRGAPVDPGPEDRESWQPWSKIDHITDLIATGTRAGVTARLAAILSGDLHHYARYAPPAAPCPQLITCGGGGAFLIGTTDLPERVRIKGHPDAGLRVAYPDEATSKALRRNVFRLPLRHWDFALLLGAVMLALVWYLDTAGPAPILPFGPMGVWSGLAALLMASPVPALLLLAVYYGFVVFARSGCDGAGWGRPMGAALLHMLAQLALAMIIAGAVKHGLLPALPDPPVARLLVSLLLLPVLLGLGWIGAGTVFAAYLLAANRYLKLHRLEVYSAQSIEDHKCFLRLRVDATGITLYPIGLDTVCRDWQPLHDGAPPDDPPTTFRERAADLAARLVGQGDSFTYDRHSTHLYAPGTPLAPHLIEKAIHIPREGGPN